MKTKISRKTVASVLTLATAALASLPCHAQVFNDDFDGIDHDGNPATPNILDPNKWNRYDAGTKYGRTSFGGVPQILPVDPNAPSGNHMARISLNTYAPGNETKPVEDRKFQGTEMFSVPEFGPGGTSSPNGFEMEARVRFTAPTRGVVGAAWMYGRHDVGGAAAGDTSTRGCKLIAI